MKVSYYKIGKEFSRVKKSYLNRLGLIFTKGDFINSKSNFLFEKNRAFTPASLASFFNSSTCDNCNTTFLLLVY